MHLLLPFADTLQHIGSKVVVLQVLKALFDELEIRY